MKKTIVTVMVLGMLASAVNAGVSGIRSNGNISGVPLYQVQCSSGKNVIIYKKTALGTQAVQGIWDTDTTLGQQMM